MQKRLMNMRTRPVRVMHRQSESCFCTPLLLPSSGCTLQDDRRRLRLTQLCDW